MTHDPEQSELLAAYLAGGLSPDERTRLETRLAADPTLAAQLEELMALDLSLKQSAGVDAILAGLDDRLASAVEAAKPLRRLVVHPLVRKAAVAAAACLLLGTTGYFASTAMDEGKLPLWQSDRKPYAANAQIDVLVDSGSSTKTMSAPTRARRGEITYNFTHALDQARDGNSKKNLAAVRNAITAAKVAREAARQDFTGPEQANMDTQIAQAQIALDQAILREDTNGRESASRAGAEMQKNERAQREKEDTISALIRNATELTRQQKYNDSLGVINQILVIDPNNDYANGAKPLVQDKAAFKEQRVFHDYQYTKQLNRAEEGKIPYDEILRYPSDWPDLSARRDQTNAQVRGGDADGDFLNSADPRLGDTSGAYRWSLPSHEADKSDAAQKKNAVPDFKDAPSFSLDSTSHGKGGGGGNGLDLFSRTATSAYEPGSGIMPFKPADAAKWWNNTYSGATKLSGGSLTTAGTGKLDIDKNPMLGMMTDKPKDSKGVVDSAGDSVLMLDVHAVPNGGTLTLGGQTLAMGDTDGKADLGGGVNTNGGAGTTQPATVAFEVRKIIRSGEMVFEVDRFDSAAATIGKIVTENGGLVATTNSDKLPNGKVRGQIIVRVPPGRLDTFILQLRALGDLKSQRLGSADVSKEYYDLESDLKAGRAMEARLLDMIKNGKGEIKDLLEAEKELANWRGKIEKIIGQQKYYDNLVSLATLTITLQEKDIATPAAAVENESIAAGVETDDVEKARGQALEILKDAKARIVSSDLKKLDAGQVASTIVADIPPDGSGAVVDRIKQLGKVARLESTKSMTADPNASSTSPSPKLERKDSRLTLSLYNVANVQPRQTTTMELACTDVSATYNAIAAKAIKAGGRVVKGGAAQGRGNNSQADGVFEVPADAADAFLGDLKSLGDVITLATSESADTANVTASKRGFSLTIMPATALPARQAASMRVEAGDVDAAAAALQAALLQVGGRVVDASSATDPAGQSIAHVTLEAPLAKAADLVATAKNLGIVRAISSTQNPSAPSGNLAKARLDVTFATPGPLVSNEGGLLANIRNGLSISAKGLVFSAKMIVVGLCFVLPWAVVLWAGLKIFRRRKATPTA